jgi:hypothetical protein
VFLIGLETMVIENSQKRRKSPTVKVGKIGATFRSTVAEILFGKLDYPRTILNENQSINRANHSSSISKVHI